MTLPSPAPRPAPRPAQDPAPRAIPKPRGGLLHIIDAAGYSLAGARRLWQETAARLELLGAVLGMVLLAMHGARLSQWLIFIGLMAALLVVEALNTAIEVLTDRISPEWSLAAKHAKDLGSLAVGLTICVVCGYLGLVLFDLL